VPKLDLSQLKKPIKEFSGDEIRAVLEIFRQFDADASGTIDQSELNTLCEVLMVEANVAEADKYTTDGKVDPMEFFAWYIGCTKEEAEQAFVQHAQQFDALRGKSSLKEYTEQQVKDVLAVMTQFDANNDGNIDAAELQSLCDVLMIEATVAEADTLTQNGKIDAPEFFAFYVGCTREEAEKVFTDHGMAFYLHGVVAQEKVD